jgi:hypothetical protein
MIVLQSEVSTETHFLYYEDGIILPVSREKYYQFTQQDEEILAALGEYTTGAGKRIIKITLIGLTVIKLSFAPVNATVINIPEPVPMEKVVQKEKRTFKKVQTPDSPFDNNDDDDDDNKKNPDDFTKLDAIIIAIGALGLAGYACYYEEINALISNTFSNISQFFDVKFFAGTQKKPPEREFIEKSHDGINSIDVNRNSVEEIMSGLPDLIFKAQKERIKQEMFKEFMKSKPVHLTGEEMKLRALKALDHTVTNPFLKEKMEKYVSDIIQIIKASNKDAKMEAIKKIIADLKDLFSTLKNMPNPDEAKISKVEKEIKFNTMYQEKENNNEEI